MKNSLDGRKIPHKFNKQKPNKSREPIFLELGLACPFEQLVYQLDNDHGALLYIETGSNEHFMDKVKMLIKTIFPLIDWTIYS